MLAYFSVLSVVWGRAEFLQLVIDFYLGFYLVHMRHRVPLAFGRTSMVQTLGCVYCAANIHA